jgi:hypothetical protein
MSAFAFDTGLAPVAAVSGAADETQDIRIISHKRARTMFNRIRANIESHEDQDALAAYWQAETLLLDALYLFDPHVIAELRDIYETHRAALLHGGVNRIVPDDPRRPDAGTAQTAPQGQDGKAKEWFDEL